MAEPVVGVALPALQESASARFIICGEFWEDGVCHLVRAVTQAFLTADGGWVRGFHDPLHPECAFALDGHGRDECDRLRAIWRRMAALSAEP